MSYNISTMFIWQYFNNECDCPMCKLRQKTESDLADTYLSHAVMVDEERSLVNKYGFCEKHFDQLYSGKNKLGLALQQNTRLKYVSRYIKNISSVKDAEKQATKLQSILDNCLICKRIEDNMARYFETVAKLYNDDEKFRNVNFKSVKSFCFNCYIRLLNNSKYAKKNAENFIADVNNIMKNSLSLLDKNLTDFTMAFDYHSAKTLTKEQSSSLNVSRTIFYGEKPQVPDRK